MSSNVREPEEVEVPSTLTLQVDRECGPEPGQIATAMETGFGELMGFAGAHHMDVSGAPRSIYRDYGPTGVRFTLAVPIGGDAPDVMGAVRVETMPGGRTLRFTHLGPYDRLMRTYDGITAWMKAHGRMRSDDDWALYMPMWEEYVSDPERTPPGDLLTYIHLPLRD